MTRLLVIYNPIAGRGRVRAKWPAVEGALQQAGVSFEAVATTAPLEAVSIAHNAVHKYTGIIGVGGDGTIHEIVNGLMQASDEHETIPVGLVPLGNGDDFAKMIPPEAPIGGQPLDWRLAVAKIAEGKTRLFDVGRMMGDHSRFEQEGAAHYFVNGMDVGFGAHAAANFTTIPKALKGMSAYFAAVLKTMIRYPRLHLRVKLDDLPSFDQATAMMAVTNGRCFANGFWVCPEAKADDGLFDLMVGEAVGRLTILGLIPKFLKGTHLNEPVIRMYRAKHVTFESDEPLIVEADGEIPYIETHCLEIDILPKKLRLFV
ncbi:MAG: diacylglycerol kinase family lipid kinase [Anaerolineales bacterium]